MSQSLDTVSPIEESEEFFKSLFASIPEWIDLHRRDSATYKLLATETKRHVQQLFSSTEETPRAFGPFGELRFPYYSMGAIDSLDLFGLDELIILSFYWLNSDRYKNVADMGTNIGLHTLAMNRSGYDVRCFEPDPDTFKILSENLARNGASSVEANQAAVSVEEGESEFTRVNGNRTGSHLSGAKENPYGDLERFPVKIKAFAPIAQWADLMKIDVEGHEAVLITSTDRELWENVDAMMEIGTEENAKIVYEHLAKIGVNMFSQKKGWQLVTSLEDVPTSHREGSLFVSTKENMNWA